jgi:hypothetical protein
MSVVNPAETKIGDFSDLVSFPPPPTFLGWGETESTGHVDH